MSSNYITVYKPSIRRKDLEYVLNCMVQDKIDYGDFARNLENRLKERVGIYDVLAVNSYFSAIELVLSALDICEGDEVIIPSFAPQIYLNIISLKKAIPVLVDLEKNHFKPSIDSIRESLSPKTKALILYHYFGYSFDPNPYFDLVGNVVEDISSVIGAKANDQNVGTLSKYAIADFSPKGIITTGEGGAIFCNNKKNYHKIISLNERDYSIEDYYPRYTCLMPDLNAAMGVSQDESLNHRLKLREAIGKIYEEAVTKGRNSTIKQIDGCDRFYSYFPLIVKSSLKDAISFFKKNGIEAIRPFQFPLHHYLNLPKEKFPNTEYFYLNTLLIPIHSSLTKKEVDLISKVLTVMI
ncbi:MAG TPA: DegT/DnrJ/EryC1/StrS aminotransferase family protein [Spirochaetota bacterium]|nr:DegT/DnrJ/EryC1/StrS aminotransferase family protein [Spirochaetota bacterium]